MLCKICGSTSAIFASAELLQKYEVSYFRCQSCGFVQTEEPYWLAEAYSKPINDSDTGIIARNTHNARVVSAVLRLCLNSHGRYLDHGGGYGILVRMMRDRGFDFYREDKYCQNLFASGFDIADAGTDRFDMLTAFEVAEHFVDPGQEMRSLLKKSDAILFSTELIAEDPPQPAAWWYYGLHHGQHISFYTRKSLQRLADQNGLLYCNRGSMHLFTRTRSTALAARFKLAAHPRVSMVLDMLSPRTTLTYSDCVRISGVDITDL